MKSLAFALLAGILLVTGVAGARAQPGSPLAASLRLNSIQMIDAQTGWGLVESTVFRTTDGGQVWVDVMPRAATHAIGATPYFLSATQAWIATDNNSPDYDTAIITMYRTVDGGQSWEAARLRQTGAVTPGRRYRLTDLLLAARWSAAGQSARTASGQRCLRSICDA